MNIIPQNYVDLIKNVIISSLNNNVTQIINGLINGNTIDNYINVIKNVSNITNDIGKEIIIKTLDHIEHDFFISIYRKKYYDSKGKRKRTIMTAFGEITFYRRVYKHKLKTKGDIDYHYIHLDRYLGLPKRDYFDPYICSLVIDFASDNNSQIKVGKMIGEIISPKVNLESNRNLFNISRQQINNILIKASKIELDDTPHELDTPENIYVMADEKWVHNQREDNNSTMVKSAIIFEGVKTVSKFNAKTKRNKTINKHVISSCSNDIWLKTLNYIDYVYEEDKLKNIFILGDGASWIKQGKQQLSFNKNIKVTYCSDKFHIKQAINNIIKDNLTKELLFDYLIHNKRKWFKDVIDSILTQYPDRSAIINQKANYILGNWTNILNSYFKCKIGCSMESNICHIYASIFSNRPKAYRNASLEYLVTIRTMKVNNMDLRNLYLNALKTKEFNSFDDIPYQYLNSSNIPVLSNGSISGLFHTLNSLAH